LPKNCRRFFRRTAKIGELFETQHLCVIFFIGFRRTAAVSQQRAAKIGAQLLSAKNFSKKCSKSRPKEEEG
jgi:hypothetical protein